MQASLAFASLSLILFSLSEAATLTSFEAFVQKHGRTYVSGSAEYTARRALYNERLAWTEEHNRLPDRQWIAGVNKLWDWTDNEMQSLRGWDGSKMPAGSSSSSSRKISSHAAFLQQKASLPEEKMWSMSHPVRNQGDCGSCWAIATATVLEGHVEIYTGKARSFSAQQIVECTPNARHCGGDGGCQGATAELAFDWVMQHGCAEETEVPYTGADAKCSGGSPAIDMAQLFTDSSSATAASGAASFGMTGWETLPKNEYEPLARALAERGPVAVSVAADAWFNYESGIFNGCGKDAIIDHAVTAIGYGTDNGRKYWTIQNSWGADWGENGHIRLERHSEDEYCGMNSDPQKGVACQGETAPVPVCGMCGVLFDSVVPHFD